MTELLLVEWELERLKTLLNQALEICCPNDCEVCIWAKYCTSSDKEID